MALEAEAVVVPEVVQGEDKSLDISLTDAEEMLAASTISAVI